MNERIKELAKEATIFYSNGQELTFDKRKFAELIVQECAGICDERARSAPIGSDEQCEADDCSNSIKKYFGVEE